MGAWIETIRRLDGVRGADASLPSWERGLKLSIQRNLTKVTDVAPFMGAWIETNQHRPLSARLPVAPFMGAWIETRIPLIVLPGGNVAPFMGAWIET